MEALGTKDFAVDFPFVGSDDLLDFSLDVELDDINKENINFSSSVVNGGSSSLPVTGEGEEDLEWLYAFPPVPVEFDILDDKLDMGVLRQLSPDSVLENVVSSGGEAAYATSGGIENRVYQGIFRQLPSGFPYFARKKRIGRKRRTGFGQANKHLSLVGHEISVVNVRNNNNNYRQEEPPSPVSKIVGRNGGQRSCSHCGTDTTPQWRVGPMGPKTLCNACGVRYNSGRLVPEYRPACSPTFSPRLHSNSHRKIIEMRKQKEQVGGMVNDAF